MKPMNINAFFQFIKKIDVNAYFNLIILTKKNILNISFSNILNNK